MGEGQGLAAPTMTVGAALDVAEGFTAARTLGELAEVAVDGLHRLIGGDLCVFNVLGPDRDRALVVGSPADAMAANPHAASLLITHADQHPQISGWADGSVLGASTISDFLAAEAFHRLELYQGVFRPIAVDDVLTATFSHPREGMLRAISVMRGRRGFTAAERASIGGLARLARSAHDRIVRQLALDLLLSADAPRPVLVLGPDLQVVEADPRCQALLQERGIRCAVGHRVDRRLCDLPTTAAGPTRRRVGDLDVTMHVSRGGDATILHVELAHQFPAVDPSALGVTPRQAEVLGLLALGRSNRQIARALAISPNTVRKHLEQIYARLGVSNRTEAAARVRR